MILIRTRIHAEVEKQNLSPNTDLVQRKAPPMQNSLLGEFKTVPKKRHPLFMTLLDWEKVFDKIDHKYLCEALEKWD